MTDAIRTKSAATLAAIFASIFIVSVAYIIAESNHNCVGDGCPVCTCITQCLDNLRTLGTSTDSSVENFFAENFAVLVVYFHVCLVVPITLANQKVRMDN
ncbi:MAG: hypothetical protein K6G55_08270 [Selenomonadaceae bacterium]|nr:hypothetical protein [Selenomonadaceae bacterium]